MKLRKAFVFLMVILLFLTACAKSKDEQRSSSDVLEPAAGRSPAPSTPPALTKNTPKIHPVKTDEPAGLLPESIETTAALNLSLQDPYQSGDDVLALEQRLQNLGYSETGLVDGVFDEQTDLAVRHLQWLNDLPIDGVISQKLFERILIGEVERPRANPPFPARSLSQYTTGLMMDGFLNGRLVDLGYLDNTDQNFNPFTFGVLTDQAVKDFQKRNGYQANGVVDFKVWESLFDSDAVIAEGDLLLAKPTEGNWTTHFYPILEDVIDLAFDGHFIWVLHSSNEDAFGNLLLRVDPDQTLLNQAPPIMLGDFDVPDNRIAEMIFDGNRLWFLQPQSFEPPRIISLIPDNAEKFIHTAFTSCDTEGCFTASALGFDGKKLWATVNDRAWAINRNNGQGYLSHSVGWSTDGEMAFDGKCMWMAGEVGLAAFHTGGDYACTGAGDAYSLPNGPVVFDGRRIWVAAPGWNVVYWLDVQTGVIGDAVQVGANPEALVFDGEVLWVANTGDNTVQGVDVRTGSVGEPIPTGRRPIALIHDGQNLWVANQADQTLQRIDVQKYQIEIIYPTATPVPSQTATAIPTATPTLPTLSRTLRLANPWMHGDDVLELQNRLILLGYSAVGEADGYFGPKTDEAVRHFQQINKLVVDGIVGPITWQYLFSDGAKGP